MGGILEGKRILVAGVTMDTSLGYAVAKVAQEQGAQVVITNYGRALSITRRIAKRLPVEPAVVELDVTNEEHLAGLADALRAHVDGLDGVVHSIAFAPQEALGGNFLQTSWPDAATALHVSAYSLKALATATLPLLTKGSAIVGLTFDATVAWPVYDWMGVAKAGLESCARYLARDLGPKGIRVNLVSAGPTKTISGRGIPGFDQVEGIWERAPLGWDASDNDATGRACVALLSDFFPRTTGEIVHVDGGYHAMGA